MFTHRVVALSALVLAFLSASTAFAAPFDNPNGNTRVVCQNNPSQTYELYIPPSAPATNRPILYAFDPGGNGKNVLLKLAPAAAANGWIIAASNNFNNQLLANAIVPIQAALIQDTEARWNVHPTRRFAGGFSGGSRASLLLAYRYPTKICGTLCMGAGRPYTADPVPVGNGLIVRMLIGTQDSNLIEDIPDTQIRLINAGVRCEVSTYPGGHVWPSPALVLSAARWLNENAQIDPNAGGAPQTCSGQSWFGQAPPAPGTYWNSLTSDTFFGPAMYEDFHGVAGPISRVQWCGVSDVQVYYDHKYIWLPRESDSDTFIVSLHPNVGGLPGPAVHQETVTAERVDGPNVYGDYGAPLLYTLRHYTARLSSPVTLSSGWVRIQHVPASGAIVFWMTSDEGNWSSLQEINGSYYSAATDLTLCLSGDELGCSFTASSTLVEASRAVQFHGTVTGNMNEPVTWLWDFGDGTTATGTANPTHVYTTDGTYTVTVTATTPTRTVTETQQSLVRVAEAMPAASWGAACMQLVALLCLGGMTAALKRRSKV